MARDFTLDITRFLGIDNSSEHPESLSDGVSPDMVNLQVTPDYHLKRRDGFYSVSTKTKPIRGIYYVVMGEENRYLAVAGDTLYHSAQGFLALTPVEGVVPGTGNVTFFHFYSKVYLLTGDGILEYDGENLRVPQPYIPTLMISTNADGSGVVYEEVNLLTRKVKQLFSGDDRSCRFVPITTDIKKVDYVKVDGVEMEPNTYIWDDGDLVFILGAAPRKGVDNIEIQYELEGEDLSPVILKSRFATAFGGASDTRAFLYGNAENPAVRYHSGIVDGKPEFTYFPETAVSLVGNGDPITSILCHYDRQLIFTTSAAYYSYLEYMTGTDGKLVTAFPVFPLNDERGNCPSGQAVLIENTPYTLTENGLFQWISTNIRDERNAKSISEPIDRSLRNEKTDEAVLFNRKDTQELYVCIGSHCYVYNYRLKLFYYYDLNGFQPRGFVQGEKDLFFFAGNSIFKMAGNTDEAWPIFTRWRSRFFDFSKAGLQKKLFGMTLYLKAEEGEDFRIGIREDHEEMSAKKILSVLPAKDSAKKRVFMKKRRFRLLEVEIETDGRKPFSLLGLSLKGRITDRED